MKTTPAIALTEDPNATRRQAFRIAALMGNDKPLPEGVETLDWMHDDPELIGNPFDDDVQ